jgi:hypothetical protein
VATSKGTGEDIFMWALATLAKLQNARARMAKTPKLECMIARVFVVLVVVAVIVVLA